MRDRAIDSKFFYAVLTVVSVGFVWVVVPLFGAVLWGVAFAILFEPLNAWFGRRWPTKPGLAAFATTVVVLLLVILPAIVTAGFIAQEGAAVWRKFQAGQIDIAGYHRQVMGMLPRWLADVIEGAGLGNLPDLVDKAKQTAADGSQPIAAQLWIFGQSTLDFTVSFFVMLYLLFFLLRDGAALVERMRRVLPLDRQVQRRLFTGFEAAVRSTVKGNIVVAAIQGTLGGLALMVLGIPAALLWGVLMAFLSLLPAVGAALVWGPVAIYLLATGQVWQGAVLIAFGVLVIGLVDNVLRPILVGKETKIPDYVVLVTTIGGMSLFGINGFVVGPLIAAMFIAGWDLLPSQARAAGEPVDTGGGTAATPARGRGPRGAARGAKPGDAAADADRGPQGTGVDRPSRRR
jgi:predicted PurR-regulated permease PerM